MKKKSIIISTLTLLIIVSGYLFYTKKLAPTKVAVINYPDFMTTKMMKSNTTSWVKIQTYKPDDLPNLKMFDQILIFGMGIELPKVEEKKIIEAKDAGVNVFVQAMTNPRLEHLANMHGKQYDYITGYMDNGGTTNYRNMFNYIRRVIDQKTSFTDTVIPPKDIPNEVLFYKEENAIFKTVADFETYTKTNKVYIKDAPKVLIFTSVPGPFNVNRDHLTSLIQEFESRKMNVYPVSAFRRRVNYIEEIKPDLIVYLPHGKLSRNHKLIDVLKQQNVPVLCPISAFKKYDDWLKDKQGMFGGLLSQSVTMPEIDGGIVPYTVFAQYQDENGYLLFQAIPDRLKKFGELAENYLKLRKTSNKDKKIAIVYFKGPGKNALVASNMEVLPSMHNLLLNLQKNGYDLGDLPQDYNQFEKDIYRQGPVLGPYAEGAFDKLLREGNPELIPAETYNQWCAQTLPKELIDAVEDRYGKAPGSYMAVTKNNQDYLAVARLQYGNVVLIPQPLPGLGDNEFKLIHGAKVAPPHTYIAPYLWIQKSFKADAVFHFGTHGSLEFLPGKQIALSNYDWADPLIGVKPHFYIYTISNVGEAMIAKRRSYAVTQSHLTPPFIEAQALGEQQSLRDKIHKYEQLTGTLKKQYALSIKKMAVEQKLHEDLDLDSIVSTPYNEEDMMKLSNYLEEIDHEKITGGLYTMGTPYKPKKVDETVLMMMVNSLSYNLSEIDIQKGIYKRKQMDDKLFFNRKYTHPSERYIKSIVNGKSPELVLGQIVLSEDRNRANIWKTKQKLANKVNVKMFTEANIKTKDTNVVTQADKDRLKELIVRVIPQPTKLEYIKKIESDKEYDRMISLLNPKTRQKAKRISRIIPAMGKALKISEDKTVNDIVKLIQRQELRQLALTYINDENLEQEVAREKVRQDKLLQQKALSGVNYKIIEANKKNLKYQEVDEYKSILDFYKSNKQKLIDLLLTDKHNEKAKRLGQFLKNDYDKVQKQLKRQISQLETTEMVFAQSVFQIEQDLKNIPVKKQALQGSPKKEFETVVNSLNGGYTAPSSGGDPISNPSTVPTGRNLFAVNTEQTPSKESWSVAKKLAKSLLKDYLSKHHGKYPKKISFTLWSSSFIETEGTTIAQILYFLGVEPIWDNFGRVHDIRVIPLEELGRPRIDVVVQTSGQLRDLAASRLFLINRAIAMVATLDENQSQNFVGKGIDDAESELVKKGFSPKRARELAKKRIFGGVNGNYGTGIMGMVEKSDRWNNTEVIAKQYINNMGAVYADEEAWGSFEAGVFEAALLNTQAVVQPRQSNTWGALSLDHVYEFMGGLNLAVNHVTGSDPESYFNDFRNASTPRVQGLKEAIWVEGRTTLLNPRYIKELTKGGASSAETFAETFRNTFGWNVMKPSAIDNRLWDELYDVYVQDKFDLDLHQFFKNQNPYALQEMTAVMLETVRKGMWKATSDQIKKISELHAKLVKNNEAGCSEFVCDNLKLKDFIAKQLDDKLKSEYEQEIKKVREAPIREGKDALILKKEKLQKIESNNSSPKFLQNKMVLISSLVLFLLVIVVAFILRKKRK